MQKKNAILIAIGASALVAGLLMPIGPTSRAMAFVAEAPVFVAWVLLYLWYKADVAQRRLATSTTFNGLVIAFTWLALPSYFVRSRGLLRGVVSTILFYVGMLAWPIIAVITASVRHAAGAG